MAKIASFTIVSVARTREPYEESPWWEVLIAETITGREVRGHGATLAEALDCAADDLES